MVLPGAIGRLLRRELSRRIFVQPIQKHALGVSTCVIRQATHTVGSGHGRSASGPSMAPAVKGETSSLQVGICSSSRDSEPLRVLCDALNCPHAESTPLLSLPSPHSLTHTHASPSTTHCSSDNTPSSCACSQFLQVSASLFISRSWTLALPKKLPALQGSAPAPCSRAASDFL